MVYLKNGKWQMNQEYENSTKRNVKELEEPRKLMIMQTREMTTNSIITRKSRQSIDELAK